MDGQFIYDKKRLNSHETESFGYCITGVAFLPTLLTTNRSINSLIISSNHALTKKYLVEFNHLKTCLHLFPRSFEICNNKMSPFRSNNWSSMTHALYAILWLPWWTKHPTDTMECTVVNWKRFFSPLLSSGYLLFESRRPRWLSY